MKSDVRHKLARLGHVTLAGVLLCALLHSWVGHTLIHGHHHAELSESSYATTVRGDDSDGFTFVAPPALVVALSDFSFLQKNQTFELASFAEADQARPSEFRETHHSRGPPSVS